MIEGMIGPLLMSNIVFELECQLLKRVRTWMLSSMDMWIPRRH